MTVSTRAVVSTVIIVMDLAGTDKRTRDRIRGRAAGCDIMTAVTARISTRYQTGAVVNCRRRILMDIFPRVRRWVMTGRTGY